jgi:hypothetical protein
MKSEALKPKVVTEEPEVSGFEALSEEEKQEKVALMKELEKRIKDVEEGRADLQDAITEAERSKDWSKVSLLENILKSKLASAKTAQRNLEGRVEELTISAEYKYKNKNGKEIAETIELDFETEISSMIDLYKRNGIEVPVDFKEQMQSLWEKNADAMTEAVAEKGFDQVLFIPENLPKLKDLEAKMTAGYEKEKGNKTYWYTNVDNITETVRSGTRIILVHKAPDLTAHPELNKTLGKEYGGEKENGKDNKAEDFIKDGQSLTLSEYLILQRDVFEKTGVHLDSKKTPDGNYIYWTWLPGSRVGSSVVDAYWNPDDGRLNVYADTPGSSYPIFGCRPSRCFQ